MLVNSNNWEDAEKYFTGCYIKVKEYGENLVLINKATPEGLYGTDNYEENVFIEYDGAVAGINGYDIDYVIPRKAYFQYGSRAYFLFRIPARMWKKGINKANTRITFLKVEGTFHTVDINFNNLMAYVNKPGYSDYKMFQEYESTALSPRFAMTRDGKLFLDKVNIGKYYNDSNTLIVKKLFYNDVKPLFHGVKIAKA